MQVRDRVGDQPAVDSEVAMARKRVQHRGRDLADADLDGVAVRDQARDVQADGKRPVNGAAGGG